MERGEERRPVDLALTHVEMLVDAPVPRRIDDRPARPEGVGHVHVREHVGGVLDHRAHLAAHRERVRRAIEVAEPVAADAADEVGRLVAVLDEVVRMWLDGQRETVPLEHRHDVLDGAPERGLGLEWAPRVACQLGVETLAAEFDGHLAGLLEIAHGGGALPFLGARPGIDDEQRRDADPRLAGRCSDARGRLERDAAPARGRQHVEARRELDILVADLADGAQHLLHGEVSDHRRVDGELHGSGTLPPGDPFFKRSRGLDPAHARWYCRRAPSSRA